jgi:hypothetical protein
MHSRLVGTLQRNQVIASQVVNMKVNSLITKHECNPWEALSFKMSLWHKWHMRLLLMPLLHSVSMEKYKWERLPWKPPLGTANHLASHHTYGPSRNLSRSCHALNRYFSLYFLLQKETWKYPHWHKVRMWNSHSLQGRYQYFSHTDGRIMHRSLQSQAITCHHSEMTQD